MQREPSFDGSFVVKGHIMQTDTGKTASFYHEKAKWHKRQKNGMNVSKKAINRLMLKKFICIIRALTVEKRKRCHAASVYAVRGIFQEVYDCAYLSLRSFFTYSWIVCRYSSYRQLKRSLLMCPIQRDDGDHLSVSFFRKTGYIHTLRASSCSYL